MTFISETGSEMFTYSNLVYGTTYTIYVKLEYTVETNEAEYHYIDLIPVEFTYYGCVQTGDLNGDGIYNEGEPYEDINYDGIYNEDLNEIEKEDA